MLSTCLVTNWIDYVCICITWVELISINHSMNLNDSNHVIEPTSLCFKVYNKMEQKKYNYKC